MAAVGEFTDSTDWLNTPLSALTPLESALRCQVCKDFFSTPMITSCSHTFCSLCIRRYLSQEGKCPACRESDQEMKLRRNWAVEELVVQFTQSRKSVLDFARKSSTQERREQERPKKKRKIEHKPAEGLERRNTRSQTRHVTASQASQDPQSTQEEIADSDEEGSVYQVSSPQTKEPHDGLVECPCCHRRIKEAVINSHLDRCISGLAGNTPSPSGTTAPIPHVHPGSIAYGQSKPQLAKERLPTINYSLLNDNALRKKLKELGIPAIGTKELMRRRHTEWVNLWNANCDSQQPKTKKELLRELDIWERTLWKQDKGVNGVMVKDFDRDQWQKSNKNDFDDLIRQAREKRQAALTKKNADELTDRTSPPTVNDGGPLDLYGQDEVTETLSGVVSAPEVDVVSPARKMDGYTSHEHNAMSSPNGIGINGSGQSNDRQPIDGIMTETTMSQRPRMFE